MYNCKSVQNVRVGNQLGTHCQERGRQKVGQEAEGPGRTGRRKPVALTWAPNKTLEGVTGPDGLRGKGGASHLPARPWGHRLLPSCGKHPGRPRRSSACAPHSQEPARGRDVTPDTVVPSPLTRGCCQAERHHVHRPLTHPGAGTKVSPLQRRGWRPQAVGPRHADTGNQHTGPDKGPSSLCHVLCGASRLCRGPGYGRETGSLELIGSPSGWL